MDGRGYQQNPVRRRYEPEPRGGGGCGAQNEKHAVYLIGTPSSGSFDMDYTIGGVTNTVTIAWNDSAGNVETAFEDDHTSVSEGDVTVTGGNFPSRSFIIEFTGDLASTAIEPPITDKSGLSGASGADFGVIVTRIQIGGT